MFCNACGKTIPEDAMFCTYCGVRVGAAAGSAATAAPKGPGLLYRLERPRTGRWIAGVCAAVAHGLNVDVTIVRVAWLVLTILGAFFTGIIAYFVCWVVIPEELIGLPAGYIPPPTGTTQPSNH